jgi:hypothetical protein
MACRADVLLRRSAGGIFALLSVTWAAGQTVSSSPGSITGGERFKWFAESTVGPQSLLGGTISAGWGTLLNTPREYGPHWEGFGKRYGMRLTGITTSNATEAGLGALWGEDPRYIPTEGLPFWNRLGHVMKMTVMAQNRDGLERPAYARFVAISGTNFLSNTWRADSEASVGHAGTRTLLGFLGRMSGNAFQEFWPSVTRRFHKNRSPQQPPVREAGRP